MEAPPVMPIQVASPTPPAEPAVGEQAVVTTEYTNVDVIEHAVTIVTVLRYEGVSFFTFETQVTIEPGIAKTAIAKFVPLWVGDYEVSFLFLDPQTRAPLGAEGVTSFFVM